MKSKSNESYFLDNDNDGHWFIIPMSKNEEWDKWQDIDCDDEARWTVPNFAIPVNGHPGRVIFKDWSFEKR